ncbi:MAG: Holliday junction resolvase RecU [Spiroplasma poulsonii]|uniref:Holliday junction resolvase RecU n=2 Tax=Spiroplasma poulsonii TaxID=2138 RepID=A0A2P6FER3_9MOLU|nr:Holliday junction resolvase RecU [Spiroplasma poulsonii]KAF0850283.1 Holliday junction resolvase RecU [Spiroplasma poulsonii]MBW1242082.1 Holliday junction resolvase RecU [Spiroplasma poulsonii]PQM31932.1 Holliday junction resolvase RecU [Spiroplasma poulsonii]PWF94399.1 Holliday junction resolvase RecU [Spiroplasma poulsonii]PWF96968.1 Holliday junction resolvase RecU [Spiroplasma poulsonii]
MHLPNNRGMFLESLLNYTIQKYFDHNIGLFFKRAVNIISLEKDQHIIIKGYFKEKTGCDYYSLYQGHYIEFEVKETNQQKFNLNNIKAHQLKQLALVKKHHGISFIIIYFHHYNRYFILSYQKLTEWIKLMPTKQIPVSFFEENGYELFPTLPNFLDFKPVLNQLINCT